MIFLSVLKVCPQVEHNYISSSGSDVILVVKKKTINKTQLSWLSLFLLVLVSSRFLRTFFQHVIFAKSF